MVVWLNSCAQRQITQPRKNFLANIYMIHSSNVPQWSLVWSGGLQSFLSIYFSSLPIFGSFVWLLSSSLVPIPPYLSHHRSSSISLWVHSHLEVTAIADGNFCPLCGSGTSMTAVCGLDSIQRWNFIVKHGCLKFLPALAWLFCPALPGSCLTRSAKIKSLLCI